MAAAAGTSGPATGATTGSNANAWIAAGSAALGAYGDYANSKKGSTLTSDTTRPAWLDSASQDVLSRGSALADRPYTPYSGERVADLSGNEKSAINNAAGLYGKYSGLVDRASTPFSNSVLQTYMNPYTSQVLDVNSRRINQQYDTQLGALNAKRGMMDAYGTDRGTLLESQLQRGRSQTLSDANIQGLSDAYDKGVSAFNTDRQAALAAATTGGALDQNAINAQAATGALDRQVRQSQDDFDYGQFLEGRDWDMNNFKSLLDSLNSASGAAGSSNTKNSTTPFNTAGALGGLAQTVAGAYLSTQDGQSDIGEFTPTQKKVGDGSTGALSNPNSAGGEAADASGIGFAVPTQQYAGVGALADDPSGIGYATPTQTKVNTDGSTTYTAGNKGSSIGSALSTAGSVAGIYTGVQQGGVAGYAGAVNSAANLAGYNIPALGYAGAVDQAAKGDVVGGAYTAAIQYAGPIAALGSAIADFANKGGDKDSAAVSAVETYMQQSAGWKLVGVKNRTWQMPDGRMIRFDDKAKAYARAIMNKAPEAEVKSAWDAWMATAKGG